MKNRSRNNPAIRLAFAGSLVLLSVTGDPTGGFVLYDRGDGVFREFSSTGDLLWESGNRGGGVEPIPFPEPVNVSEEIPGVLRISGVKVDPAAIEHTQTQPGRDGDRIYVLCLGATEHRRKIVDTYAISNGEYLGSYLLPTALRSITVLEDGRLATMETEYFPTVRLWRIE